MCISCSGYCTADICFLGIILEFLRTRSTQALPDSNHRHDGSISFNSVRYLGLLSLDANG